jgi:hypothetical protein
MKRIFTTILALLALMGGCHKAQHELHIDAPAQEMNLYCSGESLTVKRNEFAEKIREAKRLLGKEKKVVIRNDTLIIAYPAWHPVTQ